MKILFLDDMRSRYSQFQTAMIGKRCLVHWAETADEAIRLLEESKTTGAYDVVGLDHDLGPEHYEAVNHEFGEIPLERYGSVKTGQSVAAHIASMEPEHQPRFAVIHTMNPSGGRQMKLILDQSNVRQVFVAVFNPTRYSEIVDAIQKALDAPTT